MALENGGEKRRIGDEHVLLHEKVLAELQHAILTGRLKPGDRLVEQQLADELGVSRNPVREAIQVLASEGLVVPSARRGAFVARISDSEAREVIEVRALLEGQNARLAARRKDPATLKRLEKLLAKGKAAAAAERFDQLPLLNQEFHREVAHAAHNGFLSALLEKVRMRTAIVFSANGARQIQLWDEHAAILKAIVDGDETTAAMLATDHVMGAGEDFLRQRATGAIAIGRDQPRPSER